MPKRASERSIFRPRTLETESKAASFSTEVANEEEQRALGHVNMFGFMDFGYKKEIVKVDSPVQAKYDNPDPPNGIGRAAPKGKTRV